MTQSSDDNKRIIELLSDMLHEQRQTNLRLGAVEEEQRAMREEQRAMREEQRGMRLEMVTMNAKQDATVEALDRLREALVSVARGGASSMEALAALDRRLQVVERQLGIP